MPSPSRPAPPPLSPAIGGIVFIGFACLQFNDLEQYGSRGWYGWILFYGLVALASFLSLWRPFPPLAYRLAAFGSLAGALFRATQIEPAKTVFTNQTNPAGNEAGGLLLAALWLAWLAGVARKIRRTRVSQ
ncbi:MAG: transmembrane 220 family protein [Verrucomicrobiota bacterium]